MKTRTTLTKMTTKRYNRQIQLPGFGKEAQQKLADAKVLIIGAGGLGCPAITYLASAGVGNLTILDFDTVDETNLARQPIYTSADIGKPKAELAAAYAKRINEEINIEAIPYKLTSKNALVILKPFDLIIDCTDNFSARYLINDACVKLNKPWIFGAIEEWQGQVSVFNYEYETGKRSATYRCLFPEPPAEDEPPNCSEIGVIATLPAVVGSIIANEAIKCITRVGKPLANKLLYIDLAENTYQTLSISRNEEAISKLKAFSEETTYGESILVSAETYRQNPQAYHLVDIREDFEYEENPSEGENIPYHTLLKNALELDADKTYLLICEQGRKSQILARKLNENLPELKFRSLEGGIEKL
ncbi:MAG: ThiF family adenylyltransferase [Bacteroidia bacterium]